MQAVNFEEVLGRIVQQDKRYSKDAYLFLREALDYTQRMISKANRNQVRHITGQELLEGIRQYALATYGPMTLTLFQEWGVHRCEDFGEIVFNMVENGLLSKTEKDSREDFKDGYDFYETFQSPFLPTRKGMPSTVEPKNAEI